VVAGATPAVRAKVANIDKVVNKLAMLTVDTMTDMRKLDPDDARPPYVQVAAALRAEISTGAFAPGEPLPSHRELVDHFGVSLGTVKRALGDLQGAGLVVSRQGQRAFVRSGASQSSEDAEPSLGELAAAVRALTERVATVERRLDAP
jgi:DNA-binding GntR family transcriptional regulator